MIAGIAMGNFIMNVCCLSLINGLNGALETLVSQAYGSRNLQLCGEYLNRARATTVLGFMLVLGILLSSETLLIAIG